MMGSRFASALRSALPATAVAAAALVLLSAPVAASAAAVPAGPSAPATCLPHCDNALYPYVESVRATGDQASTSADAVLPGGPPTG